jgi:hypothetical protein
MLTQELGGTIPEIASTSALAILPPKPIYKRRHKVIEMLAAPDEFPVSNSKPAQPTHRPLLGQKLKQAPRQQETLQLSLF